MIVIVGLIILIAAVIVGVAGVLSNGGSTHALTHGFAVFGYHVTGSTGTLFLYGIVVGGLALFGLSVLLAGARRTSRRGSAARRGLKQSRRETAVVRQARDDLIEQRDSALAAQPSGPASASTNAPASASTNAPASAAANGAPLSGSHRSSADSVLGRLRLAGRRWDPRRAAATRPEPLTRQGSVDGSANGSVDGSANGSVDGSANGSASDSPGARAVEVPAAVSAPADNSRDVSQP